VKEIGEDRNFDFDLNDHHVQQCLFRMFDGRRGGDEGLTPRT
jgi:hypothetical protein